MFTTYKDNFQIQGRSNFDHYNRKGKPKESRLTKNLTIKGDVFSCNFCVSRFKCANNCPDAPCRSL